MDLVPVDFEGGRAPARVDPQAVEQRLAGTGHRAPPSYVAFAVANGGMRFPSNARYVRNRDTGETVGVTTVYHYDRALPLYSVDDIWAQTDGQVPDGLVPIASTEFSGEVCLDYRADPSNPAVALYDYEAAPGREVGRLADSFDDFLRSIGPNPER